MKKITLIALLAIASTSLFAGGYKAPTKPTVLKEIQMFMIPSRVYILCIEGYKFR